MKIKTTQCAIGDLTAHGLANAVAQAEMGLCENVYDLEIMVPVISPKRMAMCQAMYGDFIKVSPELIDMCVVVCSNNTEISISIWPLLKEKK